MRRRVCKVAGVLLLLAGFVWSFVMSVSWYFEFESTNCLGTSLDCRPPIDVLREYCTIFNCSLCLSIHYGNTVQCQLDKEDPKETGALFVVILTAFFCSIIVIILLLEIRDWYKECVIVPVEIEMETDTEEEEELDH